MSIATAPSLRKNAFFQIEINHLPTSGGNSNRPILFEGWVTEFSDQFTSNWNPETVYGRMDPLVTYQNTSRSISLGFDIVSDNAAQAQINLAKVNRLIQFLYPVYDNDPNLATSAGDRGVQNVLKAAPLLSLRWTNLIASAQNNAPLIGHMQGLNYAPDVSQGGFIDAAEKTTGSDRRKQEAMSGESIAMSQDPTQTVFEVELEKTSYTPLYIPKVLALSFTFTVLHTHLGGWYKKDGSYIFGSEDINGKFPNSNKFATSTRTELVRIVVDSNGQQNAVVLSGSIQASARADILGG